MTLLDVFETYDPSVIEQPYVIAEAGVNHEGSMDLAKRLIDEAAEGGADAIKFQTYKANTLASKDSPSYWDLSKEPTKSQFKLFQKYDKFWKSEYESLKRVCEDADIEFLSTPFDVDSCAFLNDLMPAFKISSSDLTTLPFIEHICSFGKPILLSTGAAHPWEITQTADLIMNKGLDLCLLHCVLNYPTQNENAHLGMILDLRHRFPDAIPGYSDHTLPEDMSSLEIATLLGARILEKHFTHDKTLPGNDHYHAMDHKDLRLFVARMESHLEKLGSFSKRPLPSESLSRKNARRSLVANSLIPKGTPVTPEHLTWKRPGTGIAPRCYNELLGQRACIDIEEDTVLEWRFFEPSGEPA